LPAGILPFASHDTDREEIVPGGCQDDVVFSSQWEEQGGCLRRDFRFVDFATAFAFMTRVAELAEEQNHHPDWSNSWNRVVIELRSHDEGAITDRDHRLAEAIDRVFSTFDE
jgi:4a-hydroxytetrahydrobiopterin dehydratase